MNVKSLRTSTTDSELRGHEWDVWRRSFSSLGSYFRVIETVRVRRETNGLGQNHIIMLRESSLGGGSEATQDALKTFYT